MHTLYLFLASKIHKVLRWSCPLLLWPSIILLAAIGFKRGFNHSFFKELSWLQQLKNMNYFLINLPFLTFFNMGSKHHRQILTSHLPKKPQFTWTCEGCLWKKKKNYVILSHGPIWNKTMAVQMRKRSGKIVILPENWRDKSLSLLQRWLCTLLNQ